MLRQKCEEDCIVRDTLFHGPDSKYVLEVFPPNTLHLMLRSTNHILKQLAKKCLDTCGQDLVIKFVKDNHIVRQSYHSGDFEGNQCTEVLKKVDKLETLLPKKLTIFTDCLKAFRLVVKNLFAVEAAPANYPLLLRDFEISFLKLGISETPSFHSTIYHVKDWYDLKGQSPGLGWYSEQATEHSHADFRKNVWEKGGYKLVDTHPKYPERLKAAHAKYNKKRL